MYNTIYLSAGMQRDMWAHMLNCKPRLNKLQIKKRDNILPVDLLGQVGGPLVQGPDGVPQPGVVGLQGLDLVLQLDVLEGGVVGRHCGHCAGNHLQLAVLGPQVLVLLLQGMHLERRSG